MRKRIAAISIFCMSISVAVSGPAFSANAPAAPKDDTESKTGSAFEFNKKDPIYITSDWMEVAQVKTNNTYKRRVVTLQADMTNPNDSLPAYYDDNMKQMKQIVAEGKVNATQ